MAEDGIRWRTGWGDGGGGRDTVSREWGDGRGVYSDFSIIDFRPPPILRPCLKTDGTSSSSGLFAWSCSVFT